MKLIASVGGWNFPSKYWSEAVKSKENREHLIKSMESFMEEHKFDGVDLDWEYPCSEPR